MKDNYPLLSQSEERIAPWNQKDPAPTQVDCCVSYCLSKSMPVTISNYDLIDDEPNFDNTNFIEEFENDNNTFGILSLLTELQHLSQEKINHLEDELSITPTPTAKAIVQKELTHYKNISKATKDWIIDDLDVIKDT